MATAQLGETLVLVEAKRLFVPSPPGSPRPMKKHALVTSSSDSRTCSCVCFGGWNAGYKNILSIQLVNQRVLITAISSSTPAHPIHQLEAEVDHPSITVCSGMLIHGEIAVAVVQKQVMVVQGARTHELRDRWLDVYTFSPFGDRLFLARTVTSARIASTDVLTIFPPGDAIRISGGDVLELPPKAFSEFLELRDRSQKKYERMLSMWLKC